MSIIDRLLTIPPGVAALVSAILVFLIGFLGFRVTAKKARTDEGIAATSALASLVASLQTQLERSIRAAEALTTRVTDLEEVRRQLRASVERLEAEVRNLTEERNHLAELVATLERNILVLQRRSENPVGRRMATPGVPKPVDDS